MWLAWLNYGAHGIASVSRTAHCRKKGIVRIARSNNGITREYTGLEDHVCVERRVRG